MAFFFVRILFCCQFTIRILWSVPFISGRMDLCLGRKAIDRTASIPTPNEKNEGIGNRMISFIIPILKIISITTVKSLMKLIFFKAGADIITARNTILNRMSIIFIKRIYLKNEPTLSNHGKRKCNPVWLSFFFHNTLIMNIICKIRY